MAENEDDKSIRETLRESLDEAEWRWLEPHLERDARYWYPSSWTCWKLGEDRARRSDASRRVDSQGSDFQAERVSAGSLEEQAGQEVSHTRRSALCAGARAPCPLNKPG